MAELRKKRVLYNSNYSKLFTGFGKNTKNVLTYLQKTGKYELLEYAAQMQANNPDLQQLPWKAHGALPFTPPEIQVLNSDPAKAQRAAYGEYFVEKVVSEFRPDVAFFVEDAWGIGFNTGKNFWGKISSVFWATHDSIPLIAKEDATKTKHYWTWSDFARKEFHKQGKEYQHVKTQYPLVDLSGFYNLGEQKKREIRAKYNISPDTFIIGDVFRNQLRKLTVTNGMEGFALFKKQNPKAKAILLLVTNFGEGWDIMRLATQYGVNHKDIWTAYVSSESSEYVVHPFAGNDQTCPFSGKEKSLHTVSVGKGVTEEQLNELYNIMDVFSHPATSGACELPCVEAAAAEKIILTADYSYGEDIIELNKGSLGFDWAKYTEFGTHFIKSSPYPSSIAKMFTKVYEMPPKKREELGKKSREWAKQNYDLEVNGKKIEEFIDSLPFVDWEMVKLEAEEKNQNFPFPQDLSEYDFLTTLYKEILKLDEGPEGHGRLHWVNQIKNGMTRQQVHNVFINVAIEENNKHKSFDFNSLVDWSRPNKRALFLIKESIGDIILCTSLFESFQKKYPNVDLYVMCEQKYFEVLEGNARIFKVLPYIQHFEQEMFAIGAGQNKEKALFQYYFHPAIHTQRQLSYLSYSNLIETYSRSTALQVGSIEIEESYFPNIEGNYITFQNGSGQQSKNYDYMNEVLDILSPLLKVNNIRMIQLGGKEDSPLKHCEHFQGKTTIRQAYHLLRHGMCHIGPDSWQTHVAGFLGKPLVSLYGSTSISAHGPAWKNPSKTFLLESHRNNRVPSYSQEHPKTINKIPPENVINAILEIFNGPNKFQRKSYLIGEAYNQTVIEWVPDLNVSPQFLNGQALMCRMDYHFSEENLSGALQTRPVSIITDKPININLLTSFRKNVVGVTVEVRDGSVLEFVKNLKSAGIKYKLYNKTASQEEISSIRLTYFDIGNIERFSVKSYKNFVEESAEYQNTDYDLLLDILSSDNRKLLYRSNKYLLSNGNIYLSKAAWIANQPVQGFEHNIQEVIPDPVFWEEIPHFYIFRE